MGRIPEVRTRLRPAGHGMFADDARIGEEGHVAHLAVHDAYAGGGRPRLAWPGGEALLLRPLETHAEGDPLPLFVRARPPEPQERLPTRAVCALERQRLLRAATGSSWSRDGAGDAVFRGTQVTRMRTFHRRVMAAGLEHVAGMATEPASVALDSPDAASLFDVVDEQRDADGRALFEAVSMAESYGLHLALMDAARRVWPGLLASSARLCPRPPSFSGDEYSPRLTPSLCRVLAARAQRRLSALLSLALDTLGAEADALGGRPRAQVTLLQRPVRMSWRGLLALARWSGSGISAEAAERVRRRMHELFPLPSE